MNEHSPLFVGVLFLLYFLFLPRLLCSRKYSIRCDRGNAQGNFLGGWIGRKLSVREGYDMARFEMGGGAVRYLIFFLCLCFDI